jgi:hypothetical protein
MLMRSYFSVEPAIGSGLGGHIHRRYGRLQDLLSADLAYKGPSAAGWALDIVGRLNSTL